MNLHNKEHVKTELNKVGINISTTRTNGQNSFRLIYESYGLFCVNAVKGTELEALKSFTNKWTNIIITSNM